VTGSSTTLISATVRAASSISVRRASPYSFASASISRISCRRSADSLPSSADSC
jgi:hypothetical protein